jgi:16S rRNA U1498 N3-methylase RsmE
MHKNNLIATNADKGKTLVILTEYEYKHKISNFIQGNQFTLINKDPTSYYQKIIKHTLKQCNNIIQKEQKWKYTRWQMACQLRVQTLLLLLLIKKKKVK